MLNYEIGGNEIKIDASEAIADIPANRSLVIEQLTSEAPVHPELVKGLQNIDQVFDHYKPQVDVEFENREGQTISETFHFQGVDDFSVKKMTSQSSFLNEVSTQKDFHANLSKQLRSNKVLQRVLENEETKQAAILALQACLDELNAAEN